MTPEEYLTYWYANIQRTKSHRWQHPVIESKGSRFSPEDLVFSQKCEVCQSRKRAELVFRGRFLLINRGITYSSSFEKTVCYGLSSNSYIATQAEREKLDKEMKEYADTQKRLDTQTQANLRILRNGEADLVRKKLAVYRLYRYCDMSPSYIAHYTDLSEQRVRVVIGDVFRRLCLSDDRCVFKKVLQKS